MFKYQSEYNLNNKKCPFCYINKEKTIIINSKPPIMVIFSNPRLVPGHILVIPKRHIEKLSELKREEKKLLINTVIDYQEKIISKISSGCDIRQNYHPFQKQGKLKVDHLHIHLIPREFKDKIYQTVQIYESSLFKEINQSEIETFLSLFKED